MIHYLTWYCLPPQVQNKLYSTVFNIFMLSGNSKCGKNELTSTASSILIRKLKFLLKYCSSSLTKHCLSCNNLSFLISLCCFCSICDFWNDLGGSTTYLVMLSYFAVFTRRQGKEKQHPSYLQKCHLKYKLLLYFFFT